MAGCYFQKDVHPTKSLNTALNRYCAYKNITGSDASDCVQETWVRALDKVPQLTQKPPEEQERILRAFLYYVIREHFRKTSAIKKKHISVELYPGYVDRSVYVFSIDQMLCLAENQKYARIVLEQIRRFVQDEPLRRDIVKRASDRLNGRPSSSLKEIAEHHGVDYQTVNRAQKELRTFSWFITRSVFPEILTDIRPKGIDITHIKASELPKKARTFLKTFHIQHQKAA